jgi:hypothetical protein
MHPGGRVVAGAWSGLDDAIDGLRRHACRWRTGSMTRRRTASGTTFRLTSLTVAAPSRRSCGIDATDVKVDKPVFAERRVRRYWVRGTVLPKQLRAAAARPSFCVSQPACVVSDERAIGACSRAGEAGGIVGILVHEFMALADVARGAPVAHLPAGRPGTRCAASPTRLTSKASCLCLPLQLPCP